MSGRQLTPMLRQYLEIKAQHPDAVLLYRMGDFYELFYDDAERAAPILEVQLTARNKGKATEAPMCGVPHHALDAYVGKLLGAGLRVAICDQVEEASEAKGLVRREVTRVMTPGTLSEPELLEGKEENLLAVVAWDGDAGGAAFLDVSTGNFFVRRWDEPADGVDDLEVLRPPEVLYEEATPAVLREWVERRVPCWSALEGDRLYDRGRAADLLEDHFGTTTIRGFGLDPGEPAVRAAAAALAYARETQHSELAHVRSLSLREARERMVLDPTTLANLEVFRSLREGGRKGTLLSVLDRTVTAPGGRTLRDWLRRPLREPAAISRRHDAVDELLGGNPGGGGPNRERLRQLLAGAGDPERLMSRAVLGSLTPREAAALRDTLDLAPELFGELKAATSALLAEVAGTDPLPALAAELHRVLAEDPAASVDDGGVIAEGVDEELDRARSLARDTKRHILSLEKQERETTGIGSLKIRYNKVFGYYAEVTKANTHLVPEHYIRKQTLVNAERYVTPQIKELEEQILSAEEKRLALERRYFDQLRATVAAAAPGLADLAAALGTLDVLTTFAERADDRRWVRPKMGEAGGPLTIEGGRHPVVEATSREPFVPNDVALDGEEAQIVVLTGPNMGGKSTFLRQVALIVLMAQAGSFVPADAAEIGVVDRIFTRVGASDDLARGESTFMVEMIETANILHHAGAESLVVLDEVGRGTATFDGLSLAWAIVEYLHEHGPPKTLFATHYHELTELAALLPRVVNLTLAVKEWKEEIIFLRRVVPGTADKSYGIQVARLAGLPRSVVERAAEVLRNLEAGEYDAAGRPRLARGESTFMVEMIETANILHHAGAESLVV
ncbi:MAG TPA: DNA mismatch repair protein MutS, partial [Thermoanaerobaculia bacterium]|nr:DNA mismatch repair protein MutS [Thermoanaerobaculia bacterium]